MRSLFLWITFLLLLPATSSGQPVWTTLNLEGGSIIVLAIHPQDSNIVYAGTEGGRLYKSTNGGREWNCLSDGISDRGFSMFISLTIDIDDPERVYVATMTDVLKTSDGGLHWTQITPQTNAYFFSMAVDPRNFDVAYLASYYDGVLKTTDGGNSWAPANNGLPTNEYFGTLAINPEAPDTLYLSSDVGSGIFKTMDGGANWIGTGPEKPIVSLTLDPVNPSTVYAIQNDYSETGYGIHKSTDSGLTWFELTNGEPDPLPQYMNSLAIDPANPRVIYAAGYGGIHKSIDGGINWMSAEISATAYTISLSRQNGLVVYAGTDRGVYSTIDEGDNWTTSVIGIDSLSINDIAVHPQKTDTLYVASESGVFKSSNGGSSWTKLEIPAARSISVDPQNPSIIYASSGALYKSTDFGQSWEYLHTPENYAVAAFALDPSTTSCLYVSTYNGIYKSTNGGLSWVTANNGFPADGEWNHYVRYFSISPQNPTTVYAATYTTVYKSTDGGGTWVALSGLTEDSYIYALDTDPDNSNIVYVSIPDEGVFKSTDGGSTWTNITNEMDYPMVLDFAIDPQSPNTIYAANYNGIFRSVDGGLHWIPFNDGMPGVYVESLNVDPFGGRIFAGTNGYGIWAHAVVKPTLGFHLEPGGAASIETFGKEDLISGYSTITAVPESSLYGTAVFSFSQNGIVVSEAGVPASPPTTSARIFIDYRSSVRAIPARDEAGNIDVNTGIAIINPGTDTATITYTLRNTLGDSIAVGHGTLAAGRHFACFIDQLKDLAAPDFILPDNFQTAHGFATLEISSNRPLSVLALRGTLNQRDEFLITTTPVADLNASPDSSNSYFPQFVDGQGYTTSIILMNTTNSIQTGSLQIKDNDGNNLVVNEIGGTAGYSFRYSIPPNGFYRFQTDGSPAAIRSGSVQLLPNSGNSTPVGSGVFGYNPEDTLVSESGIPSTKPTTHARIYVDLSEQHNTGIAIANTSASQQANVSLRAYFTDGATAAGNSTGSIQLARSGNTAKFADQMISGLPAGFRGVLDIISETPFAALALRSLVNERQEFLMTAFPVADATRNAPSPIVFPHIVDGGGYTTEFIMISSGEAVDGSLSSFDENGQPMFAD